MHAQCHTPHLAVITLPICPLYLPFSTLIFTIICNFMSWLHTMTLSPSNIQMHCNVTFALNTLSHIKSRASDTRYHIQ